MDAQESLILHRITKRLDVNKCWLTDSSFVDVNLAGASFDDINLSNAHFHNVNLSNWRVQDANLTGMQITQADLRRASISHSLTEGMSIDGILVSDLFAAYRAAQTQK